jgi:hypothetical protein
MWSVENPAERPELQQLGLQQSIERILAVIRDKEESIPRSSTFLTSINQGFAAAMAAFLRR